MLLSVHGGPGKLRWLQFVVEVPLAFWIEKQEHLMKFERQNKKTHHIVKHINLKKLKKKKKNKSTLFKNMRRY